MCEQFYYSVRDRVTDKIQLSLHVHSIFIIIHRVLGLKINFYTKWQFKNNTVSRIQQYIIKMHTFSVIKPNKYRS